MPLHICLPLSKNEAIFLKAPSNPTSSEPAFMTSPAHSKDPADPFLMFVAVCRLCSLALVSSSRPLLPARAPSRTWQSTWQTPLRTTPSRMPPSSPPPHKHHCTKFFPCTFYPLSLSSPFFSVLNFALYIVPLLSILPGFETLSHSLPFLFGNFAVPIPSPHVKSHDNQCLQSWQIFQSSRAAAHKSNYKKVFIQAVNLLAAQ